MIQNDRAATLAIAIVAFRRVRSENFPAASFAEPAWDLMLELFIADAEGRRLTAGEVSQRCNISPGVLSRWLQYLSKSGLVVGDGDGDLTDELTLSGEGMMRMERILAHAFDLQSAVTK